MEFKEKKSFHKKLQNFLKILFSQTIYRNAQFSQIFLRNQKKERLFNDVFAHTTKKGINKRRSSACYEK
jgi:hypothetical protein